MTAPHDCTVCHAAPGIWRSRKNSNYYACDDCFTDRTMTELEEWKQAASVEAGLRREFQDRREKLRAALVRIVMDPALPDGAREIANAALDSDR